MSFGYSISDFITGANITYRLIQALSETQGACVEYQEAMHELGSIQQTFLQVSQMKPSPFISQATINAASHIVLSSMEIIGRFLERTKQYQKRLSGNPGGRAITNSWRKMGWALFKKEELQNLRDTLQTKLMGVSVLLSAAQFHGDLPPTVGRYQIDSDYPSSSRSSSPPSSSSGLRTTTRSPVRSKPKTQDNPPKPPFLGSVNESNIEEQAPLRRELLPERRDPKIKPRDPPQLENAPEVFGLPTEADVNIANHTVLQSSSVAESPLMDQGRDEQQDMNTNYFNHLDRDNSRKIIPPTWTKSKATSRSSSPVVDKRWEMILEHLEAEKREREANFAAQKAFEDEKARKEKQKPIKFKDAMGRKFSFPFHLCSTWAGMEELINQAFLHVDIIGPHVAEGHFDLLGPSNEIILPQVWDVTVEPDWTITMHMWPMPEPPKAEEPAPAPPPSSLLLSPPPPSPFFPHPSKLDTSSAPPKEKKMYPRGERELLRAEPKAQIPVVSLVSSEPQSPSFESQNEISSDPSSTSDISSNSTSDIDSYSEADESFVNIASQLEKTNLSASKGDIETKTPIEGGEYHSVTETHRSPLQSSIDTLARIEEKEEDLADPF